MLFCVGELLFLVDGEVFCINVLVFFVDGVFLFVVSNGFFFKFLVFVCCLGEDVIVEVFEYVGEEFFIVDVVFVVVVMVVLLVEFDFFVDGELDWIVEGVKSWGEDDFVEVDFGEEEFFELYEVVVGLGFFVEVVNIGWGFLEDERFGLGWGFLEGFVFCLGVVVVGFIVLDIFCGDWILWYKGKGENFILSW